MSQLHLPQRSCSKETGGIKGMVFRILHLIVTQASTRSCLSYCYVVRADAAPGTLLRVLHKTVHLVFIMAFSISYYEVAET